MNHGVGLNWSFCLLLSDSIVLGARHVNPELFGVTGQKGCLLGSCSQKCVAHVLCHEGIAFESQLMLLRFYRYSHLFRLY